MLEKRAQGHLHAEHVPHPGDELGGQKGVPAQLEEVVGQPHPLDVQQLGHDARQLDFGLGGGRDVFAGGGQHRSVGRGQGLAVDLVAGGEGHGLKLHEEAGDHVFGQNFAHKEAKLAGVHFHARFGHEVGHDALVAGRVLPHDDHAVLQAGELAQPGLDLPQLDAEAPHLDLMVDAAQEFDVAVGQALDQVAGAIEALAGAPPSRPSPASYFVPLQGWE